MQRNSNRRRHVWIIYLNLPMRTPSFIIIISLFKVSHRVSSWRLEIRIIFFRCIENKICYNVFFKYSSLLQWRQQLQRFKDKRNIYVLPCQNRSTLCKSEHENCSLRRIAKHVFNDDVIDIKCCTCVFKYLLAGAKGQHIGSNLSLWASARSLICRVDWRCKRDPTDYWLSGIRPAVYTCLASQESDSRAVFCRPLGDSVIGDKTNSKLLNSPRENLHNQTISLQITNVKQFRMERGKYRELCRKTR